MITDSEIIEVMINHDGSFVFHLGKLFILADNDNQRRLKEAFPEYWKKYTEIAIYNESLQRLSAAGKSDEELRLAACTTGAMEETK